MHLFPDTEIAEVCLSSSQYMQLHMLVLFEVFWGVQGGVVDSNFEFCISLSLLLPITYKLMIFPNT